MTTAAELYALQETDLALDRLRGRLAEIEKGLEETEDLIAACEEVEEKSRPAETLRARQKDLELAVDEVSRKASQVESKLYGGSVTSPKELQDLDADLK